MFSLDERIFLFFNGHRSPLLDILMPVYTSPWIWVPFYVACFAALIYKYGWIRALMMLGAIVAAVGLADYICASIIRPWFSRLRPSNLDNPFSQYVTVVNGYRGGRYGFPSCHAANTFALIGSIVTFTRSTRFAVMLVLWGLFVCYTRMYLGVHYPTDLLMGATIGLTLGITNALVTQRAGANARRIRDSRGYRVRHVQFNLVNTNYTLALGPILIPTAILVATLLTGFLFLIK